MALKKTKPSWKDVKTSLTGLSQTELIKLLQELYASDINNQQFLHARFALGDDVLGPYKASIHRWLWPEFGQDTSVSRAKKAIADYKKAVDDAEGLAELMVFYCEQAAGFSDSVGLEDNAYFDALIVMFDQALENITVLPKKQACSMRSRLENVCSTCHRFGYGVGDDMDELLANYEAT